jgi:hypothetical protein
MRNTHIVSGLILTLLALIAIFLVIPLQTSPPTSSSELSPDFLPLASMIAMGLFSAALLLRALYSPSERMAPPSDDEEFGEDMTGIGGRELREAAVFAASSASYVAAVSLVGFVVASMFAIGLMAHYLGMRTWWQLLLTATIPPVLLDWLIWHLFTIQMPPF